MQKKHMKQTPNIKAHHVFLARAHKDLDRLYAQDFEGGHMCSAAIINKESIGLEWWKDAMPPIEAPQIQLIKWRELYDKWWPIVPMEKWKDWYFYHTNLSVEKKEAAAVQQRESKKQRAGRKRAEEEISAETETAMDAENTAGWAE